MDKIITCWYLWVKDQRTGTWHWDYNHYSEGYDPEAMTPTPKDPSFVLQKNWNKGMWQARKARLVNKGLPYDTVIIDDTLPIPSS